ANKKGVVEQNYSRASTNGFAWGISKDCADPVSVIRFMDFWLSDTGHILFAYGIEGIDYTMVDGKPVLTEEVKNKPESFPVYHRAEGCYEMGAQQEISNEVITMNDWSREGFNMYLNGNVLTPPYPVLVYNEAEQAVIDANMPNITTLRDEYQQQCVMGSQDVASTWDQYINDMNSMGLQEVLAAETSALQRYLASMKK
ncbi:MAG: hypothetical protein FWC55_09025, partial [Firmicutes bacterium]|nr:hypothetical protein [Bacillota bacterium]